MIDPNLLLDDETGNIKLYSDWLKDAGLNFNEIEESVHWQTRNIKLFGKIHPIPRLEAWMGDSSSEYTYSGKLYKPEPWNDTVLKIRSRLKTELMLDFNGALLNYYRNGNDSMGWHSDNEPELGSRPTIGILSLGCARVLAFRELNGHRKLKVSLEPGSLLIMKGSVQKYWQHSLPKRVSNGSRISCTFRCVI